MPSFAIEVAGESNPLTEDQLVRTLTSAASSESHQLQSGTKQLQQWEKSPEYYKHLQSVYIDRRHLVEVRYLAIIQLKNGIDKYWRKTAANAVSKEDKAAIRSRLLPSALDEPDHRLALQNALVIAKVARFEYPNEWPDVLNSLTSTLRSQSLPLHRARALLVLLNIVKDLSTGRLRRTRTILQSATPEIVHVLGDLYTDTVNSWSQSQSLGIDQPTSMQISLMTLKVLRRLLTTGYEHPNRESEVVQLWHLTQQHLGMFIQMEKSTDHFASTLIQKHMIQLAKLHHEMARDHPAAFATLPHSLELTRAYWSLVKSFGEDFGSKTVVGSTEISANEGDNNDTSTRSGTEKLSLKGLLIVRACAKMIHNPAQTFKYSHPEDKAEKVRATELLRNDLFTHSFVQEMMEILVSKFFVFRQSDLEEWQDEPEDWERREEGDGDDWEFSIRSCSEKLFLDLAINYKDILLQPLLQVFYAAASLQNEDALFKDSVYTAIGLAAPVLHENLDFDGFIRNILVAEVQKRTPGFGIIRRRAAILISQWMPVKVSPDSQPQICEIFQHLLDRGDPTNDQVVRITAGRRFKAILDSWEFDIERFLPYADTTLNRLFSLIYEVEQVETKLAILETISRAVERIGPHIGPFAERIVSLLPPLWEISGEEHLMKQAILTVLTRLIEALQAQSLPMHSMVFPLIQGAVEAGSAMQLYLLDDALDLWASVLQHTPDTNASPDLLALIPYLYPLYELGSETLRQAFEITESYVMLAPEHILSDVVRIPLFTTLSGLLGNLKQEANGLLCNLVGLIIKMADKIGGEAAVSQTAADLTRLGFFPKLLEGLQESWTAHCSIGPHKKNAVLDGVHETDHFAVLAFLSLGSLSAFCEVCQHSSSKTSDLGATMKWLLEEWFSHFDNIGDPSLRKLMALALTNLLETKQPWIFVNLQSLMTIWTDVVAELREQRSDWDENAAADPFADSLFFASPRTGDETDESGFPNSSQSMREKRVTFGEYKHTINLPQFVKAKLEGAIAAAGGAEAFQQQWLVNVDRDVLDAFSKLGIMG